ncbi:glucosaminidase domain-containing protein [Jutongia sp.]
MTNQEFIQAVASAVQKYAVDYGIKVHSPIIAQAILESGWGQSKLASQYHNYFGLKCGSSWTGKSVNMTTQEEYQVGTLTTIKDNFRVFDSLEDGIKGYFDFIQYSRYANLKGVTDPFEYIRLIKEDGYATSSQYVDSLTRLVNQYNLTQYDRKKGNSMSKTRSAFVAQAQSWIGCKESNGTHRQIIDVYNSHKPLARGYSVKYTDAWCATFVSACAIKTGMTDIIPTECGCGAMITLMKNMGIWVENDAYTPSAGDIIMYDWDDTGAGDNMGNPDHVGIVEKVINGVMTIIEGNISNSVGRRTINVNARYIRGFGVPKFSGTGSTPAQGESKKSIDVIAKEVLAGAWGNGDDRKNRLTSAGYDYASVQAKVNELCGGSKAPTPSKSVDEVAKEVINGKWGNGEERKTALKNAGYDYSAIQNAVNKLLSGTSSNRKSVTEIAKEVIRGKWGNGSARKTSLEKAGYNYSEVQKKVNELLK